MYVGTVRDITERKRGDRMKSEFVSTVSHELCTPLTAISGSLGLISGGRLGNLPEQIMSMVGIAYKNAKRLSHLINDLLDIEKLSPGKMDFDMPQQALMPIISQAIEGNQGYGVERQVDLTLVGEAVEAEVRVDSQRLMQILSKLFSNAVKYSPQGGRVEITTELRQEVVRVTVTDHGPGIPEEFRPRIFQKFARADSSDTRQKGRTGLGLAITRELVERMGGNIGFASVEGLGASFYFELPQAAAKRHSAGVRPLTASQGPRVLVVEDEPDLFPVIRAMLGDQFHFYTASTLAEARARIALQQFDVVLLAPGLPDGSGWDLLPEIRKQQPQTRIVILSGNDTSAVEARNVEAVLLKSQISFLKLLDAIDGRVNSMSKETSNERIASHSACGR